MRKLQLLLFAFLFSSQLAFAQSSGINFQGIARNASGEPLVNQKITLRFAVIQSTESGTVEYLETKEVTSNGQGMFSVVIGDGVFLTKTGNFTDINWKLSPKFLKVELDPQGGTNFALMGTSRLQAVPFAYYANGVDAENVQGVLPLAKGGTGVASISALKGALQLDQVSNTSDANKPLSTATQTALATKVDKVDGKALSTNDYTTAEKSKLAAITGTNTGDQDLSGLATTTALATKANATDVTTALATKVDKVEGKALSTNDYTTAEKSKLASITGTNTGDQDLSGLATTTALANKANATDVTTALATKVDKVEGKALSTNDYTTAEKTKLAAITGTNTGDQDLSGLATTTALATKANATDVTAGLATKVDKVQGKELSTNDYTTAEKTKLAAITGTNTGDQDLSGLATTTALATKANATDVTAGLATKVDKVQGKELSTNDYTTAEKTKLAAITGTNTGDQDLSGLATTTALATKANATDVTAGLATKVDKVQGKELSTNDYTTAEKTKLAAITGTNTGDQDLSGLATTTALATKANASDVTTALATKVDKVQGKELSTNDYTTAEKTKLAAITGTNTGDQDLSGYATTAALNSKANSSEVTTALATKANASDVTTALATKVDKVQGKDLSTNDYTTAEKAKLAGITGTNTGDQDLSGLATTTALATKANATDVTAGLATKVDKVQGKELSTNDYTTAEKAKLAAITGTNTGDQDLSGYATIANLNTKANASDLTTALATKVDKIQGKELSTNDYTTTEKNKLAAITGTNTGDQDLSGYATISDLATKASTASVTTSLNLKEDVSNKSILTDLGGQSTSDALYPSQKAVKTYVDSQINNGGIADGSILTVKIADRAITGIKLANTLSGYKNFPDGAGKVVTSTNVTPDLILPVGSIATGGSFVWQSFVPGLSGKLGLIEFETINPTSAGGMPPVAYVEIYSGSGIGGTLLGRSNDVTISMMGRSWKAFDFSGSTIEVFSGSVYTAKLIVSTSNQNWVFGDNNLYNFGTSNVSSTWDHNFRTSLKLFSNDVFLTESAAQNLYGNLVSNATHTGEVTGSTSLTITDGAVTTSKLANGAVDLASKVSGQLPTSNIADAAVITDKINNGAITTVKIANNAVDLTSKVSGQLPSANIADGAITSAKIGGSAVDLSAQVTGLLPIANGGTGVNSATGNTLFAGPNGSSGAPSFRALVAADIPQNLSGYIQNAPSSAQAASIHINGSVISGSIQNTPIGSSTPSTGAFTTLSSSGNASIGGTLGVSGVATFTAAPIISSTTASRALFTNANKQVVSNAITGTGNVVMSASPTLTGTVNLESFFTTSDVTVNGKVIGRGAGNLITNTVIGLDALTSNTTGEANIAMGSSSLKRNTVGMNNIGLGTLTLNFNTEGNNNFAAGYTALYTNTTGSNNFALGYASLSNNISGSDNFAVGNASLFNNTIGSSNTAIGQNTLYNNTLGTRNIAIGTVSLRINSTGNNNIAIGYRALFWSKQSNNVAIGDNAGYELEEGSNNIIIGTDAQPSSSTVSNEITLGNSSITSLRAQITSITSLSDRRDKTNIVPITEGLDFIKQLKPVTFTWDTRDKAKVGVKSAGFIAQDLLALQKASAIGDNLDLVSENNPEKLEARYANLLPVMVKAMQEQQAIIEQLKLEIEALKKLVKE